MILVSVCTGMAPCMLCSMLLGIVLVMPVACWICTCVYVCYVCVCVCICMRVS